MIFPKVQRNAFVVIFGGVLLLALLCFTLHEKKPQPVFEGKTARYWVKQCKQGEARLVYMQGPIPSEDMDLFLKASHVFRKADAEFLIAAFHETQTPYEALIRFLGFKIISVLPSKWGRYIVRTDAGISQTRLQIIRGLVQKYSPPEAVLPIYLMALSEPRGGVAKEAAIAIGNLGSHGSAAAPALIKKLAEASPELRQKIALTLASISPTDEETISALTKLLQDNDHETRLTAAIALLRLPERNQFRRPNAAILEGMIPIIQSENGASACDALMYAERATAASPDKFTAILIEAVRHKNSLVRTTAINMLATMAPLPQAAVPMIEAALRDPFSSVREAATNALQKIRKSPPTP